ncbi:5-carboxymethyl-2-hydroxymuconate delta isomerase [Streptomyces solaniscabiei]|uniref:5-carboxymethyl-2-hydroxymuconate delta isomerase n=1 Tax=Streptomyces solaniscabiei TaxID=2683255 RepID=UPI001CE2EABD|nr:5-carboxymethyl-2-hydroxymuconate delta isomerase [Streptomyces solaniscabiei]
MPHLTVDYSARLASAFDHEALVRELHVLVGEESGSAGVCKRFVRPAETYIGDQVTEVVAFLDLEIGLRPGRSERLRARLAERAAAAVDRHFRTGPAQDVVVSAEVRELTDSYRLSHTGSRARE